MESRDYRIAALEPAELDSLRQFERQLSERSGHPIALIAYEPGDADTAARQE